MEAATQVIQANLLYAFTQARRTHTNPSITYKLNFNVIMHINYD